jgi:hypothetical protein
VVRTVHHIVDAVAPFFVRRFAGMRWAILTPRRCLRWDGESLESGPGRRRRRSTGRRTPAKRCGSPTTRTSSTRRASSWTRCSARCHAATGTTCPKPR